jgi:hypothetical protein
MSWEEGMQRAANITAQDSLQISASRYGYRPFNFLIKILSGVRVGPSNRDFWRCVGDITSK